MALKTRKLKEAKKKGKSAKRARWLRKMLKKVPKTPGKDPNQGENRAKPNAIKNSIMSEFDKGRRYMEGSKGIPAKTLKIPGKYAGLKEKVTYRTRQLKKAKKK